MSDTRIEKGIITYIYLENFVTYNNVTIRPGRNLNVIIGPNGTGKSTIVCAIVLGLGGKPSTIGRASHVEDYVKAGCDAAKIEIHLKNGNQQDIVIVRTFNTQGKSMWMLNGRASNIKEVQELTRKLNIQIDNLCQFLPQDKVQDFSKMNAQELLENTQRSVGDPKILEYHKKLIECRSVHKTMETEVASKKTLLDSKIKIYESLKEAVSSVKERKLIKKKIENLKQKKAWMLYDQMRRELLKLKKKKETVIAEKATLENEIQPINDAINKINREMELLRNSVHEHTSKVQTRNEKLRKLMKDILSYESTLKDCEDTCKHRIECEKARDSDIELARQQKSKLENDLSVIIQDNGSEQALMKQIQETTATMKKHRDIIAELMNRQSTLKQEEEQSTEDIKALESQLQTLNIEAKRLHLLRERSIDAYKGVLWLRENQDKFSGKVHEPMLLSINVKDVNYAKYLENIIPFRDLVAFVCENKRDMNLLLQYLRDEQKLQVNAVHSDPMRNVSMQPRINLDEIRRFGFKHYLASLIDAPPTILKYLVAMYNLSNIPVGTTAVEDNVEYIPNGLRCFFSENNVYMVNVSKYTGEKSTRMQPVGRTGMLSIVLDKSKLQRIEEKLTSLRERKKTVIIRVKALEEQICEKRKTEDKDRTERNKYQQSLQNIQGLKSRLAIADRKIENLQNERTSIEEIQQATTNKIKAILSTQFKLYKAYNTELQECFKYITANEEIKLALKLQQRLLIGKQNSIQGLREKLNEVDSKLRQLSTEVLPLKKGVQRMYDEALQTTNGISPTDEAFGPINKAFNKLPPTIEEINNELNVAQAKVFCMGNNIDGENVLRRYEEVQAEIEDLKMFLENKTKELDTTAQNIEILRQQWLPPLQQTVERINTNFSSYFSAMNCTGEVVLSCGDNSLDFEQYGLKIRVKFRNTDQLQELTRHHQSGGERAVTTAIYMISLQELSRVPFRCVDEINQGMDAVNERRVFNLLVKMTGRQESSQYFLLTPKLLPGLEYSETVTVHCVFNGPFVVSHTEFDTEEYCKHIVNIREKENAQED